MSGHLLQMDDDGEAGEEHHWQEAVAQDTHHTAHGDPGRTHQVEDYVHRDAAHQTNTIDVAKVDLP